MKKILALIIISILISFIFSYNISDDNTKLSRYNTINITNTIEVFKTNIIKIPLSNIINEINVLHETNYITVLRTNTIVVTNYVSKEVIVLTTNVVYDTNMSSGADNNEFLLDIPRIYQPPASAFGRR